MTTQKELVPGTMVSEAENLLAPLLSPNPLVTRGLVDLASDNKVDVSQPQKRSQIGIEYSAKLRATIATFQQYHIRMHGQPHPKLPYESPSSQHPFQVPTGEDSEPASKEPE